MKEHSLKTLPEFFEMAITGRKPFEIRFDSRGFEIGDLLVLEEYLKDKKEYTGNKIRAVISDVISINEVLRNYVILKYNVISVEGTKETLKKAEAILKEKKIGQVTENKFYLTVHVGDAKEDDGREIELLTMLATQTPIVRYKNKQFILLWKDILKLAEEAGLFDEVKEGE